MISTAADVFSVSMAARKRVGELPRLDDLRAQLSSLSGDASPRERARLHLAAAIVMQDRREGGTRSAIEEARQAVEHLSAEGGGALAAGRYHLGRLVLALAVGDPADPPEPAGLAEARHLLEQARDGFEALDDLEALAFVAVELGFVAEREGNVGTAFGLLDAELRRTTPTMRGMLRMTKATLGLGDALFRGQADDAVAAFLREDASTEEDEEELCQLLGMFHRQLSQETRALALGWLEARPVPPLHQVIVLRSTLEPDAPETWIRPEERKPLEAQLGDVTTPVNKRWQIAYLLMGSLPDTDRDLRLRCAELLEEAITSQDVHPVQRTSYRHDVGMAYMVLANGDRQLVSRALGHLEAVVGQVPAWDRTVVTINLANAHAHLLTIDAAVSSPGLLDHVRRIEGVLASIPSRERRRVRDPRITAVSALLQWYALTHPTCLAEARRLLRELLSEDAADEDALRFAYLAAWCAHVQGRGAASAVDAARAAAERVGPVPKMELTPPAGESIESFGMLVRVLAGTEPPSQVAASSLAATASFRPDAVDLLLDLAEEQARTGFREDPNEVLEELAERLRLSRGGDAARRGHRMVALVVSVAGRLSPGGLARLARILRGPLGTELEKALASAGVAGVQDATEDAETQSVSERVSAIHGRALRLMDQASETADEERAASLWEEARQVLDDAVRLAEPLAPGHRAIVMASAGNTRRKLAALQPERAPVLLNEAIELYREALPWTRPGSDDRGMLSKILAEALIARGVAADWETARLLFSDALGIRRSGQFRAETLMAVIDAELAHPSRPRMVSATAALQAACEAMEHVIPQMEDMRVHIGIRATSLMAELVRDGGLTPTDARRHGQRIAASCPKLLEHAKLATFGLAEWGFREDATAIITSEFARALVITSALARSPLADRAMPPNIADKIPAATPEERARRNNSAALRQEQQRWRNELETANGERRAGQLVGIARLVARRVELGDATPAELETAFGDAYAALAGIANLEIRAFALSDLAVVWSEHHPARDFARSARLLEESLRLYREAGSNARTDTLQYLARATRFREDIPRGQAVKAAIQLYQEAAEEYRARGAADGYMVCLLNLAEALSLQEDRPKATAIKEALEVDHIALEIARLRGDRPHQGMLLGNMAWSLTLLAEDRSLPEEERARHLDAAEPLFEEAEKLTDDPNRLASIGNNRLSWLELRGAPQSELIAGRRRQLATIDRSTHPHEWSFAAHNLAELLVYPGASAAELREALTLYRAALSLRPRDVSPELHWECAHQIGALLGGRRYPGQLPTLRDLGVSPEEAYRQANAALRSAMEAGRVLGLGRNLVIAARTLGLVAAQPPGHLTCDVASAHDALGALADVLRIAPDDTRAADAEAEVAQALVVALAKQRAAGAPRTGRHALVEGAAAWDLVHLVLRARGGGHRRLRMRMLRPNGVAPAAWTNWRRVLRERDNYAERRAAAEDVRKEAPDFLSLSPSLSETLRWLGPGRAAASIVMTDAVMVLVILGIGESGPTPSVLITDLASCPVPDTSARETFLSAVHPGKAEHALARGKVAELRAWLADTVVDALKRVLSAETVELCWSPNGIAAWMPLEVLWPDGPRIWTTPCLTLPPPLGVAPGDDSALLVFADPRAPGEQGALVGGASEVAELADMFSSATRAEVLAGAGHLYGWNLLPKVKPELITDRPPSREEVLARAQGRRLLLVLAHGTYSAEDPGKSCFGLVDGAGNETPLTAEDIGERPGLLKNTIVVLLSCESGAGGRVDAGPAGLAGALLSVGAQVVIAPLWIVSLSTALEVGRAVVDHMANGHPVESLPDAVCAARRALDSGRGPDDLRNAPFVVWCG